MTTPAPQYFSTLKVFLKLKILFLMKKIVLIPILFVFFHPLVNGQNITDYYTKNKIVKEINLSKNATGTWDTSFYKVNQLSPQCAILKSSEFWEDFNTYKLYESSRDSVVHLSNGNLDIYGLKYNYTTKVIEKNNYERMRKRSQSTKPDTAIYYNYNLPTNTYQLSWQGLYYVNKWGLDSFIIARNYVNNALSDTAYLLYSIVNTDGNVTYTRATVYENRAIALQQKTSYMYVNKKLTTQRDTFFGGGTEYYYTTTDYTYDANGQVSIEQYTNNSVSDTTRNYSRTRYITRNTKNKPLESIYDKRTNGIWVEDTRNTYTYQSDTLETMKRGYAKVGTQWVEDSREIHDYCSFINSSVEVLDKTLDIRLSPNPTNGQLNIQLADDDIAQSLFDLTIFNNSGQLMYQKTNCMASQPLNIEHLKDGFYVAKITQNGRFKTQKLIVLH